MLILISTQNISQAATISIKDTRVYKVGNILKGSLDFILSPSVKIQIVGGKVCLSCQQTFEHKKFVDIIQLISCSHHRTTKFLNSESPIFCLLA